MKHARRLAVFSLAALLLGCTTSHAPLPTVAGVDLDRYYGTWYEIARLPNRFQSMCASDVQAIYRPDGERLSVLNQCRNEKGELEQARGIAKVVAGSQGARLRVSFFRPFYGDYQVLALDPDYRWVLVGEPSRQYAWILARSPRLDPVIRETLLTRADALGFDRRAFMLTRHTPSSP
jgi:apolipoprotein D and lipocalin family protein